MDEDLKALELKLAQLIAHYQALHADNVKLRQELALAQQTRDEDRQKMASASARLASLIEGLPAGDLREIL